MTVNGAFFSSFLLVSFFDCAISFLPRFRFSLLSDHGKCNLLAKLASHPLRTASIRKYGCYISFDQDAASIPKLESVEFRIVRLLIQQRKVFRPSVQRRITLRCSVAAPQNASEQRETAAWAVLANR
jgi:hypothetical protein